MSKISKLMFIFLLIPFKALAIPVPAYVEMAAETYYTGGDQIDWALLYEGAGYRHDLYLNVGNQQSVYLATNDRGTGGLSGCGVCSYPGLWGTTPLESARNGAFLRFILQINQSGTSFSSGAAANNPDGLAHAWKSNFAGFDLYSSLPATSRPDLEDTSITNIMDHYTTNGFVEIMNLITDPESFFIGFEDIYNGGDRDYNDLIFVYRMSSSQPLLSLRSSQVPEPEMFLLYLIVLFYVIRKCRM